MLMHSLVWWIVALVGPNSSTGQWSFTNRASDVPPEVESFGYESCFCRDGVLHEADKGSGFSDEGFGTFGKFHRPDAAHLFIEFFDVAIDDGFQRVKRPARWSSGC